MIIPVEVEQHLTAKYGNVITEDKLPLDEGFSQPFEEKVGSYVVSGRVSNKFGYIVEGVKKTLTNQSY